MTQLACTVAVIGAGYMAREHIRALCDIPGVKVSGIMSRTRARAEALALEFGIPHVCDKAAELYAATKADLLIVAVPELAANAVMREAVEHPWSILAEKPVGYCIADAQEISDLVEACKSQVYVALNRRFYGSTQSALADLEPNQSLRFIEVFDQQDPVGALAAGQPAEVVKNWMYANSIHVIDYFTQFGRGTVCAVDRIVPWNEEKPENVVACLRFSSGDIGLYHAIWNGPGPWACFVSTPEKRWELRPLENARYQNARERHLSDVLLSPWDSGFKAGMRMQAEEAVKATMKLPSKSVSLEEANASMRLVEAIYRQ